MVGRQPDTMQKLHLSPSTTPLAHASHLVTRRLAALHILLHDYLEAMHVCKLRVASH